MGNRKVFRYRNSSMKLDVKLDFTKNNDNGLDVLMTMRRDGLKNPVLGYVHLSAEELRELKTFLLIGSSELKQAGAQFAAMRRKVTKVCPSCKEKFTGIVKAIYCSPTCRSKGRYWRDRGVELK